MKGSYPSGILCLSILIILFLCLAALPDYAYASFKYVGTEGCKCHKSEISDWERSKHARAFDLLKPGKKKGAKKKANLDPEKDYTTEVKCLPCHVTGLDREGGYKNMAATPAMAGVGCESCHGPGSEYRALHKEKSLQFTKDEAKSQGATYGSLNRAVCDSCHVKKDNPYNETIDNKYSFDHGKALKENRSFHDYYELEAKH